MGSVKHKSRQISVWGASVVLSPAFERIGISLQRLSAQTQKEPGKTYSSKRMADGKHRLTHNPDVNSMSSYCYQDAELSCRRYGRLYTWESALRVCQSLGDGWRLPTEDEWPLMAKQYGGVSEDSDDKGRAAYKALLAGGTSGFSALLGGGEKQRAFSVWCIRE
jgi:uncharacterized protein (TIGR02145 family)